MGILCVRIPLPWIPIAPSKTSKVQRLVLNFIPLDSHPVQWSCVASRRDTPHAYIASLENLVWHAKCIFHWFQCLCETGEGPQKKTLGTLSIEISFLPSCLPRNNRSKHSRKFKFFPLVPRWQNIALFCGRGAFFPRRPRWSKNCII